jgi:hypothetical protein
VLANLDFAPMLHPWMSMSKMVDVEMTGFGHSDRGGWYTVVFGRGSAPPQRSTLLGEVLARSHTER